MLTKYDEYPLHQIADTFAAVQSGYQHWNDGHYICFCDMDGEVCGVTTLRLYQNNDVLDGFVCLRHEGKQHNIRLSRRLRPAIDDFSVGPMKLEIIEPMKLVRLTVGENEFGVSMDIVCETAAPPYEDPISVSRVEGRLLSERAVYEVVGRLEGHVTVNGKRYNVTKDRWYCFRNHSWGFMPGRGGPRLHAAPPRVQAPRQQGLRNWVLYLMPEYGGFWQFMDDPQGKRRSFEGELLLPENGGSKVKLVDLKHDLEFYGDTSRLKGGVVTVKEAAGKEHTYEVEDLGWVYCHGGGYFMGFNDGLGQGVYRGDYHVEGEVWDVSHPVNVIDPQKGSMRLSNDWVESFTRLKEGGSVGLAHYECVLFGNYEPYGLKSE